jgi:hypothetical protein
MTTPHDCAAALRALAHGDYTQWHGLTDDCTTAEAVAAFGPQDGADRAGDLGGSPTRYRIYPATAAAPHGVYAWDVNDRLVLIRLHDVAAPRRPLAQLGEPEARDLSTLPGFKTQWIYAAGGLTLHIDDDTGATAFLYAYRPMMLAEFRAPGSARSRSAGCSPSNSPGPATRFSGAVRASLARHARCSRDLHGATGPCFPRIALLL